MAADHERGISGWGGWPVGRTRVEALAGPGEAASVLARGAPLALRGLGRSYGDAAFLSGGTTVLTAPGLSGDITLDPGGAWVEAGAGTSLDTLLGVLIPQGRFPAVVPGTRHVSLGGMVAADVHGKNHHRDGALSRHVHRLILRTADGEARTVDPVTTPDLYWATLGGMGLTGVVERVRLGLEAIPSAWLAVDVERTGDFEGALARFHDSDDAYRFSVAWIDLSARGRGLGRSVLLRGNWAEPQALGRRRAARPLATPRSLPLGVPFPAPSGLLNRFTVSAFNAAYYRAHPAQARGRLMDLHAFFFPLDAVHRWNRLYGRRGFLQYQLVLPEAQGVAGLRRVLERLSEAGAASFLAVLKRFGPGEADQLLSFPEAGYTLALDLPMRGAETLALCEALDRVVLDHGGRLYLAKDARMSADTFRAGYPRWERFREIKGTWDPEGRFTSDLARRLGLA